MTSLPQTAPSRLPRAAGNGYPIGPVMMAPAQQANALTGADVWRVIRANIWLILIALAVSAVVGYLANMYLLAKFSRYTSVGYLRVLTQPEMPRGGDSFYGAGVNTAELEIEQRTHSKLLLHEGLLSQVLASSQPIRQTDWFKQFVTYKNNQQTVDAQAAKQDLLEKVDVSPVPNSRLIEVRMSYSVPKDCQTVIRALCDQYIQNTRELQSEQQGKGLSSLESLSREYQTQIDSLGTQINGLTEKLAQEGVAIGGGMSEKDIELQALIPQQSRVMEDLATAQAKLDAFERQVKLGSVPQVERDLSQNPSIVGHRQLVFDAQRRLSEDLVQFGESNRITLAQKKDLENLQKALADEEASARDSSANYLREMLQGEVAGDKQAATDINDRVAKLTARISELQSTKNEVSRMTHQRDDLRQKLDKVKDEQDKLGLVMGNDKLSPIEWSAQPDLPDRPSFPKLSIVLPMALALGLMLSLGIAFLREMTDTTVRSPRDVARVGQMTLLGMIPHESDDPQAAGARLPLAIYEAPHSIIAEQFRQVRTRLQHIASLDTTRSILVTGCSPEDGKTIVATNLAAGLALNGRRILLVDANFRRPMIHNALNVSNEIGFGDVLNDPSVFDHAVRATEVPNLSVMPLGNRPSNPTELLESQLLIDFIERALEEYDHLIFDSGPLLMVSDAIALAPRVDGVITVVRARGNSRGLLQRVRDELRRLKAEHLGVILNAVRVQGGGYYGPMIKRYYAYDRR